MHLLIDLLIIRSMPVYDYTTDVLYKDFLTEITKEEALILMLHAVPDNKAC